MKAMDIRKKATKLGIKNPNMLKKPDLIRTIQQAEGNSPCFGTAKGCCDQNQCAWRQDCMAKDTQPVLQT